jgi:hypothetical protein
MERLIKQQRGNLVAVPTLDGNSFKRSIVPSRSNRSCTNELAIHSKGSHTVSPVLSSLLSVENSCHWQYSVTLCIFREFLP